MTPLTVRLTLAAIAAESAATFCAAGCGVVTTYTHDAATRRLATLTSKLSPVRGGTTFQALTYGYDAVGNVESLTNALVSAVSTPFGGAVTYEYGNCFLIVAGLLNTLVVLDAFDIAVGRK